jgi:hypothetical protein
MSIAEDRREHRRGFSVGRQEGFQPELAKRYVV